MHNAVYRTSINELRYIRIKAVIDLEDKSFELLAVIIYREI